MKEKKKKKEVALWRLQGTHKVTVYVRSGRKQIQPPVIQTEAGNHPLLCTQGVKVTFHNTSEIGLMEELVHGFCWIGKKKPWKKGCNKRLKYVKGPEEGKDSGAKVKRLRGSYKYIYKQTNTQKSDKVMLRKLTLTTVI